MIVAVDGAAVVAFEVIVAVVVSDDERRPEPATVRTAVPSTAPLSPYART